MIPEMLLGLPCSARLTWLYIWAIGEGEYSVRGLANDLGIAPGAAASALRALVRLGLLEVVRPPAGRRPGIYRARLSPTPLPLPPL